jgi:vancomycin resistance protein YoaR
MNRRIVIHLKMKKSIIIVYSIVLVMLVAAIGLTVTVKAIGKATDGKLPEGYAINGINIGGLTKDEAKSVAESYIDKLSKVEILVNVGDAGTESATFADLGFSASADEFIESASKVGTVGNIIERYKEIKDAEASPENYEIPLSFDDTKVDAFVKKIYKKYKINPENATLTRENGQFVIGAGKDGRKIYYKKSLEAVNAALTGFAEPSSEDEIPKSISCDLNLVTVKPDYGEDAMAMVTDVLGSYTTNYGSSNTGRAQNVENGCRLVNGTVLMPGEQVSLDDKMKPYTIENGYGTGGAYVDGKVVDDIGGGICQVSTTLYNAVLYAELEVVERYNHSMTVTYVPLSRDAAIAGDWKDFVFKNSTDYPIYIEGIAGHGNITFNVYGHETRDITHRKVEYKEEIIKTIKPDKDIVTIDKTKPESYEKVVSGSWTGYEAKLLKNVYIDGVLTETTTVNTSTYKAVPRTVIKGGKKESDKDKKSDESDSKSDKSDSKQEDSSKKSSKRSSAAKSSDNSGDGAGTTVESQNSESDDDAE